MITAVVVARGGSVRLPNKALLPFGDSTLIGHKVKTLLHCEMIDRVVVGSDSDLILAEAKRAGAQTIKRDDYFCDEGRCNAREMIADMAGKVTGSVIVWAHPTNPLIRSETYDDALRACTSCETCDSLASVVSIQRHAWWDGLPLNFNPWGSRHELAAELKPVCFQDGAIFIQSREQMTRNQYFYGTRPLLFPISLIEGWDIDTREDYEAAVALLQSSAWPKSQYSLKRDTKTSNSNTPDCG